MLLVGAGGTGSMMLTHLARIHTGLVGLGQAERLKVTVWDPDVVTEANIGRQLFSPADVGQPKAAVLVTRLNAFFGLDWQAVQAKFNTYTAPNYSGFAHIVVSCVDTIEARKSIHSALKKWRCYWLDIGNDVDTGQVVLGESEGDFMGPGRGQRKSRLPHFFDLFPDMRRRKDKPGVPSCSLAAALEKQDLFVNSTVANFGGQLLWQLLRHREIRHHGFFINLRKGSVAPISVPVT